MPEIPTKKSKRLVESLGYLFKFPLYEFTRRTGVILISPTSASIHITTKCNLDCVFCFVDKESEFQDRLEKEEIFEIINQLSEMGVRQLTLGGGELMLYPHLYKVLRYAKEKDMAVGFTSNGTLWDEEDFNKIFKLGVDRVSISLDGLKGTHEEIRGKDTFLRTVKTLKKLSEKRDEFGKDMKIRINTVVLDQNLGELKKIYSFARDIDIKLNLIPLTINFCTPIKKRNMSDDLVDRLWISEENFELLDNTLDDLKRMKRVHGHLFNQDSFLDLMKDYYRNPSHVNRKCLKGTYDINLLGNGDFSPCAFTGIIGNVREKSLSRIWNSDRYRETLLKMKKCSGCLMNCNYTPPLFDLFKDYFIYPLL